MTNASMEIGNGSSWIEHAGSFRAGRQSQNLAFSGPGKQTLYMTAREGLYRVRMLSKGPDRLGK